jgi:uncharacterized protein YggE
MRLLLFLNLYLVVLFGHATSLPMNITVVGNGTYITKTESYAVLLTIKEQGASAKKTKQQIEYKSDLIIKIANSLNLDKNTIQTSDIILQIKDRNQLLAVDNIELLTKTGNNKPVKVNLNKKQHKPGLDSNRYAMVSGTQVITIILTDFDKLDVIIDRALQLGVSELSIRGLLNEMAEVSYQKALDNAFENAKNKAHLLAKNADVTLNNVISITELTEGLKEKNDVITAGFHSYDFAENLIENVINAQVSVVFAIKP